MAEGTDQTDVLLTQEVAALFGVSSETVTNWHKQGRLKAIRTIGGHRRYRISDNKALQDRLKS